MAKDNVNEIVSDGLVNARNAAIFQIAGGLGLLAFNKTKDAVTTKVNEIKQRKADDEALASE